MAHTTNVYGSVFDHGTADVYGDVWVFDEVDAGSRALCVKARLTPRLSVDAESEPRLSVAVGMRPRLTVDIEVTPCQ